MIVLAFFGLFFIFWAYIGTKNANSDELHNLPYYSGRNSPKLNIATSLMTGLVGMIFFIIGILSLMS